MRLHALTRFAGPLSALGYAVAWILVWPTEQPFWVIPFGLRFGALLLSPTRHWLWILVAEVVHPRSLP